METMREKHQAETLQDIEDAGMLQARRVALDIIANVEKVIVGKHDLVQLAATALLCRGHLLIDGLPGMGKTMFARSLAKSIGGTFKRVQGTADLLPSDLTGVYVFDQRTGDFRFRPGPVMANIVLVDEINRASPRTQSALLECMEERQVTVEGVTHGMPEPFLVLATRNPTEHDGIFPLPDTELDRFLIRLELGYPTPEEEERILQGQVPVHPIETIEQVVGAEEVMQAQQAVRTVAVSPLINEYIVALVNATRDNPMVRHGGSPRSSIAILSMSQGRALLDGRSFVTPDDVKLVAPFALTHRLALAEDMAPGVGADEVVREILDAVAVPGAAPEESPRGDDRPRSRP